MRRKRFWRKIFWQIVLVVAVVWAVSGFFEINFRVKRNGYGQEIKRMTEHLKDEVYRQATVHNPQGDIWPDWIDDFLKLEVKQGWQVLKKSLN